MTIHLKIIFLLSFVSCIFIYADGDSARVFYLNDVVITGTQTMVAVEKLPSSVQVVDSIELAQSNGSSLAEKIKYASGISFRSYGGNGALQSVSVRGMGSDYSLILIDGLRYTTFQISTVDLGIFSLEEVERIELAGGGNSSLYGADAIGGVINIITKKPNGKLNASFSQRIGSFGLSGTQVSAGGGNEVTSYRGSIQLLRGSNAYDFIFDDGITHQTLKRTGSDFSLKNYTCSFRTLLLDNIVSGFALRYSDADRGQPAAVTNSTQNNLARIHDKDLFVASSTEIKANESLDIALPVSFHYNRQLYNDPKLIMSGVPLHAEYVNSIFTIAPTIRYAVSTDYLLVAGSEFASATISSNELFPSRREQLGGFVSSVLRFPLPYEVILYPSVRYDSFSDVQGDISPKIGINIAVINEPTLRLRASYGKNYRIPTFNDMYWINGGNPNLKPERSLNFDAGVVGGIQFSRFDASIEISYFSIEANNKIVWQPGLNGMWTPKNLQSVSSTGVELSVHTNIFRDILKVDYRHNFLHTIKTSADYPNDAAQHKILPYVPQELSTVIVGSSYDGISVNVLYSFTGYRYETADNDPRYILPTYETIDANISYGFIFQTISIRCRGEVNNLTNTDYKLVSGYPIPLRNYVFAVELSL